MSVWYPYRQHGIPEGGKVGTPMLDLTEGATQQGALLWKSWDRVSFLDENYATEYIDYK